MKNNKIIKLILLISLILILPGICYVFFHENVKTSVTTNMNNIRLAELPESYKEWLNLTEEEKAKSIKPRTFNISFEEVNQSETNGNEAEEEFEKTYDLRTIGGVKPVKNQRHWGFCWAFAGTSSLESHLLTRKNSTFNSDLNPMHIGYALSYNFAYNIGNYYGSKPLDFGGSNIDNLLYWTSGIGPVSTTNFPITSESNPIEKPANEILVQTEDVQVENQLFFPSINMQTATLEEKQEYINSIKQAILDCGAVSFASMAPGEGLPGYNEENNAVYTESQNEVSAAPHMMLIVGWDDNFIKENFNNGVITGQKPTIDGAWIVQNSWGEEAGINGYYYYSYEDYGLNSNDMSVVSKVSSKDYDNIYQYNPSGEVIGASGDYAANIFTKGDGKENLKEISFFNFYPDTEYEIYVNSEDGDLDLNNATYITTYKDENNFAEYITINLDEPIQLTGEKFAIIIKINADNSFEYNIPTQINVHNYLLDEDVDIKEGQSFISKQGEEWVDTATELNASVFIKAFTTNSPDNTKVTINSVVNTDIVYLQGEEAGILVTSQTKNIENPDNLSYQILNSNNENVTEIFTISKSNNNNIHYANIIIPKNYELVDDYTINVLYNGEIKSTCNFSIVRRLITNINLLRDTIYMEAGKTNKIATKVLVEPKEIKSPELIYESENTNVATVSENGIVRAVGIGVTNIIITSKDGGDARSNIKVEVVNLNELLEGDGTEENPYKIKTGEDLNLINADLSAYYTLENDIDLTFDTKNENGLFYNNGKGWQPIGFMQNSKDILEEDIYGVYIEGWQTFNDSEPFTGELDGKDHSIIGLNIQRPDENFNGLFSFIKGGEIKNIRIKSGYIKGKYYTASLAACAINEIIENVNNSANIYGFSNMAGLVSFARNSQMTKVWNRGNVTQYIHYIDPENNLIPGYVGGISTVLHNSSINIAFNSGNISTYNDPKTSYAAGITARSWNGKIRNTYNTGEINSVGIYGEVGGIIGWVYESTIIENSYNIGKIKAISSFSGSIIGEIYHVRDVNINNVYAINSIFKPIGDIGLIEDEDNSTINIYERELEDLKIQETFNNFDFDNIWKIEWGKTPTLRLSEIKIEEGINVKTLPQKIKYLQGIESINLESLEVVKLYSDGTEEILVITEEMITGFDNTILGNQTLTITYNEFTTTFEIEICDAILMGLQPDPEMHEVEWKTQFIEGERFDPGETIIMANYSDSTYSTWYTIEISVLDCEISKTDELTIEDTSITISYTDNGITRSFDIPIQVYPEKLEGMTGDGTEENPYLISTPEELNRIRENLFASYKLISDIDMSNVEWNPIGGWDWKYKGVFDGNHYKIIGLTVNSNETDTEEGFACLFAALSNATVKDLTIERGNFSGSIAAGIVNIALDSNLINVNVKNSSLSSSYSVAGIVVSAERTEISKCSSTNNVITTTGEVSHWGEFTWGPRVGGIVGEIIDSNISDCYNTSNLSEGYVIGGIVATAYDSNIESTYNIGSINGNYICGGIAGEIQLLSKSSKLKNCYDISDQVLTIGMQDEESEIINVLEKTMNELKQESTYEGFDFENVWKIKENETPIFKPILARIAIETEPIQTSYIEGQHFDPSGMKVIAIYSDETTKEITEYEIVDDGNLTFGQKSIIISYTENNVTKTVEQEITVNKENIPPILEINGNIEVWSKDDVVLNINAIDNESGISRVTVNGEEVELTNGIVTYTVTGNNTYVVIATDNADNTTTETIVVDKIDKVSPVISDISTNTEEETEQLILTVNATDEGSGIEEYSWDNGLTWKQTNTYTVDKNGTYKVFVKDKAGNISEKEIVVENIKQDQTDPEEPQENDISIKNCEIKSIEGKSYVFGISIGTTISDLIPKIQTEEACEIVDKYGDIVAEDSIIGTGMKIVIGEKEYAIVVKSDLNGDGKTDISDLSVTASYFVGKGNLDTVYKLAGDVNNDEIIDITDISILATAITRKIKL